MSNHRIDALLILSLLLLLFKLCLVLFLENEDDRIFEDQD